MLPATERLRRASLFKRAYTAKKNVLSKLFTLYVLPRQTGSSPRPPLAGFVVAKKVHNKASKRNLVKRRVREAYKLQRRSDLALQQWYAMVFVIHESALTASFELICQTVNECVAKAAKKYGRTVEMRGDRD